MTNNETPAEATARETNALLDTVRIFGVSSPATAEQIARTRAALDKADAAGTPSAEIRDARRR